MNTGPSPLCACPNGSCARVSNSLVALHSVANVLLLGVQPLRGWPGRRNGCALHCRRLISEIWYRYAPSPGRHHHRRTHSCCCCVVAWCSYRYASQIHSTMSGLIRPWRYGQGIHAWVGLWHPSRHTTTDRLHISSRFLLFREGVHDGNVKVFATPTPQRVASALRRKTTNSSDLRAFDCIYYDCFRLIYQATQRTFLVKSPRCPH